MRHMYVTWPRFLCSGSVSEDLFFSGDFRRAHLPNFLDWRPRETETPSAAPTRPQSHRKERVEGVHPVCASSRNFKGHSFG